MLGLTSLGIIHTLILLVAVVTGVIILVREHRIRYGAAQCGRGDGRVFGDHAVSLHSGFDRNRHRDGGLSVGRGRLPRY